MTPIVACVNLKGGVGKTAIAVNFAAYCGLMGQRTLLVDLDPQTNATFSCMAVDEWEKHAAAKGTVADLLGARSYSSVGDVGRDVRAVTREGVFRNVDIIPSHLDLFTVDLDLASAIGRELRLRRALQPVLEEYDMIVCDCPPNLAITTQNALAMCSHYVVPVSPDYLSSLGVGLLLSRIRKISEELQHEIQHTGIIVSRVGRRAVHREETVAALRATFGDRVLRTEIKERVDVAESAEKHKPIFEINNREASTEFKQVSQEILERMGLAL